MDNTDFDYDEIEAGNEYCDIEGMLLEERNR